MMRFDLSGRRLPAALTEADVKKTGKIVSKLLRLKKPTEVGLRFVSEREIQRLNRAFRKKNRPTDVLSFSPPDASSFKLQASSFPYLGDIAICPPYAAKEARRRSIPVKEELIRLLVHGILHLKRYDHCHEREEMRMFALQERAVESIVKPLTSNL
ncbi:MAG: rRNA maturation RNase YbeY [Candidatus Uhrbacteria bacterium]|nr:rRNA maturation RNase YbeY [Candidatus Uhrbacteria bacterium]